MMHERRPWPTLELLGNQIYQSALPGQSTRTWPVFRTGGHIVGHFVIAFDGISGLFQVHGCCTNGVVSERLRSAKHPSQRALSRCKRSVSSSVDINTQSREFVIAACDVVVRDCVVSESVKVRTDHLPGVASGPALFVRSRRTKKLVGPPSFAFEWEIGSQAVDASRQRPFTTNQRRYAWSDQADDHGCPDGSRSFLIPRCSRVLPVPHAPMVAITPKAALKEACGEDSGQS